jgi:hypothetical protein
MDSWEKAKTVGSLLSSILLPLVLLLVGSQFTAATKEREIQGSFVELATQILRETPTAETKLLREWALKVIDRYSGVPLPAETARSLVEKTALPSETPAPEAITQPVPRGRRTPAS